MRAGWQCSSGSREGPAITAYPLVSLSGGKGWDESTHRDEGAVNESPEGADGSFGHSELAHIQEELHDIGAFARKEQDREQERRAQDVHVPAQREGASINRLQTLLDNDRVHGGDGGGGDPEEDAEQGHGGAVEEDADEEAEGDDAAGGEDFEGGARVEEEEGDDDGEGEDEPPRDLVEGGVDVFEGIVAEAVGAVVGALS